MKKQKKIFGRIFILMIVSALSFMTDGVLKDAKAKVLSARLQKSSICIGNQTYIKSNIEDLKYKCSDDTVCSVSSEGRVIAKKEGKVFIKVSKAGYTPVKLNIKVKAKKSTPQILVTFDEIKQSEMKIETNENGENILSAKIKNMSQKGTVNKVNYIYKVSNSDGTAFEATLTAQNIKPGKKSKKVSCNVGNITDVDELKPEKAEIYSGDALYIFDINKEKGKVKWSGEDHTGPVFSGILGKHSIFNGETVRILYSDKKNTYDLTDGIKATDAKDGRVDISVNTKKVNWKKTGKYKVWYTAKDSSGNKTKAYAYVTVIVPGEPERIADIILSSKIGNNKSTIKKLRAIYTYVSNNCSYTGSGSHKDWRKTGANGIRNHRGDCFTYYSMCRLLISRAGIDNLTVCRYPAVKGHQHWWNLCYVKGGWYHLDATPRQRKGYFCLQTDAQLRMYSTGSTFRFDTAKYPKRATKKISKNPI